MEVILNKFIVADAWQLAQSYWLEQKRRFEAEETANCGCG
jgi:hypothetical protein